MEKKTTTFKISTYFTLALVVIFIIISSTSIFLFNQTFKREALIYAKKQAKILLDKNLSIHSYFAKNLKPELLKKYKNEIDKGYFNPQWMSSTHAIKQQQIYFKKFNKENYYYKDAAINARSPENEADFNEREYLKALNNNINLKPKDGITSYKGIKMYYLMQKGEVITKGCLICHSKPQVAPKGLVNIYGKKKSFYRKDGDVISVISIKIPLEQAYKNAQKNSIEIGIIIMLIFGSLLMLFYYFNRKVLFIPLKLLSRKTKEVTHNYHLLENKIELRTGKELADVIDAFNTMSNSLYENVTMMEEKIHDRTQKLEENRLELMASLDEKNGLLVEKEMLMREMNHRVKNNLNIIVSILNIQKEHFEDNKDVISLIEETQSKIFTIAHFHELLYKSEELGVILIDKFISGIVEYFNRTYKSILDFKINSEMDESICMPVETARDIALIANEIITNSFKHAFGSSESCEISIKLLKRDNDYLFSIRDSGPGYPSQLNVDVMPSLGLKIVQSIVTSLHGVVTFENDNGAVFSMTFPK